jgi:hypothetical protein
MDEILTIANVLQKFSDNGLLLLLIGLIVGIPAGVIVMIKGTGYVKGLLNPLEEKINEKLNSLESDIKARLEKESATNADQHKEMQAMVDNRMKNIKSEIFDQLDRHKEENVRIFNTLTSNLDNIQKALLDIAQKATD